MTAATPSPIIIARTTPTTRRRPAPRCGPSLIAGTRGAPGRLPSTASVRGALTGVIFHAFRFLRAALPGPPHLLATDREQRGHENGADHKRIGDHPEANDKTQLAERHQR